jgi:hypothetical protein
MPPDCRQPRNFALMQVETTGETLWWNTLKHAPRESNPQPSGPKPDALSIELGTRGLKYKLCPTKRGSFFSIIFLVRFYLY